MTADPIVTLTRDVTAALVPAGSPVTIQAGEQARITQSLGSSYTIIVNGNMFRVAGKDADALGLEPATGAEPPSPALEARDAEEIERVVWDAMKTCFDPEIPVNIVDLGLVYDCQAVPLDGGNTYRVNVKMTLTAPGCGMGPVIQQDVHDKILAIPEVEEAEVELAWDPPWNQAMMSEAARLELGLM